MNERIRELATEVGISVDYLTNTKQIVLLEKFAELIVRECQTRVEQYIRDCGEIGSLPDTVIMKHFGVDGMSTEDKKTLIKELLGVKND